MNSARPRPGPRLRARSTWTWTWTILLVTTSACSDEPGFTTVELALAPPPESVASINVFVVRGEEIVASATLPPSRASISLGVPAEVPLEFNLVARTDAPGPPSVGKMPAFVGVVARSIPLQRDPERIAITAHPAGVLSIQGLPRPESERDDPILIAIEEDRAEGRVVQIEVPAEPLSFARPLILRQGRYRARVLPEDADEAPRFAVDAPEGILIVAEQESLYRLSIVPLPEEPDPGLRLAIAVLVDGPGSIEAPDRIRVSRTGEARLALVIVAVDGSNRSVPVEDAAVRWRAAAVPETAFRTLGGESAGTGTDLPLMIEDLSARGSGRVAIEAEALLPTGHVARGAFHFVVLEPGVEIGAPAMLSLRAADESMLRQGTELIAEVIDARGLTVQSFTGTLDVSRSDPWVVFDEGPLASFDESDRGVVRHTVRRPSAPPSIELDVRAVVTSTAAGVVLTSTLSLPPI